MLRCWGCQHEFTAKLVERDSLIRGREVARGGPYRLYRCPSCHRESKVEATPKGRLFASPDKEINPMEYLFSWAEPLAPEDFLKIVQWHELHDARRQAFFARDGDRRYTRPTIGGFFQRLFGRAHRRPAIVPRPDRAAAPGETQPQSSPQPSAAPIPHPYRILGVTPEATDDEIRSAFRTLARRWHPDKLGQDDPEVLALARQRLAELLEAYESLRARH